MSDQINAFFQLLDGKFGISANLIAAIALVVFPIVVFFMLLMLSKVRSARGIVAQLGKRLGYEPPYDDGMEILHEEFKKEVVERGKEKKIQQLELRVEDLMVQGTKKDASVTAAQQRAKEFEDQLRQALSRNDEIMAQANEQTQAHRAAAEQFEQHMRNMEAGHVSSLTAAQQRSAELEDKLQDALHQSKEVTARAAEQAQAHQAVVGQMEQRTREMESEHLASLKSLQQRWNALEAELQQASLRNEKLTTQAGEQAQAHRATVEQLEQRLNDMERESGANQAAFEQRSRELTGQVQQVSATNQKLTAMAGEQAREHERAVAEFEHRIRDIEASSAASVASLEQRSKALEDQLQQSAAQNESMAVQAHEQARTHRTFVEQLEQRIREIDAESLANLSAVEQHAKGLEGQLRQAKLQHEQVVAQAGEQAQAHRATVEQFEQRIRDVEAGSLANQAASEKRSKALEEQLRHANVQHEQVVAQAGDQVKAHRAAVEQFEKRIRDMEAGSLANQAASEKRSKGLEEQLRQANVRHEQVVAQAGDQVKAHRAAVEQFEKRIRDMEAGGLANQAASEKRSKELEEQLRQANVQHEQVAAQAGDQAKAHRAAVEQFEKRIRDMEAGSLANQAASEKRSKELEEQLRQANGRHEQVAAKASEQTQAHRATVEQLEQRIRDMEAGSSANEAALAQRMRELEDQLRRAHGQHEQVVAQAGEQAQTHRATVEQLEQRIREIDAESFANLTALEQRSKELEEQLRQANLQHGQVAAQAGEQAQAHRTTVEQLEQRIRDMEAGSSANEAALAQRSRELEEQLRQANQQREQVAAQAGEQAQDHRATVEQLQKNIRDMEAGSSANEAALGQRSRELEEQLRQANQQHEQVTAQAGQQAQAHRTTVEQLEQRIREMEAGSSANEAALGQRSRELEEQLRQANQQLEQVAAQAGEQAQAHRTTVEQLEQRVRDMEAGSSANEAALGQRSRELEEQLRQANQQHEQVMAKAGEEAQAHRTAVEQFEQRIREMEAKSSASLSALEQKAKRFEEQLQWATSRNESEGSVANPETLEKKSRLERLEMQIRDLEAEKLAGEFHMSAVQAHVKELEAQLQLTANRAASERPVTAHAGVTNGEEARMEAAVNASEQLLRRAEWITGCAIGAIRPLGVVAAEAYATAAFAADPQNLAASQLLSELTKLRRSSPERLPSVIEAVATFDQGAAGFFGADLAGNADLAEREAQQRYRAGLDRSALLALNLSLALRQQTGGEDNTGTQKLQEMKTALLARLGTNA